MAYRERVARTASLSSPPAGSAQTDRRHSGWGGALLGIGVMASLDEMWFHQILGWHHFYDLATPAIGLMSDGFLHAFELLSLAAGFFLVARLYRRQELVSRWAWAGFLVGMGGFQLLDGIFVHKVLRLHQIRYGVPIVPYDLTWNLSAGLVLAVGLMLIRRARKLDGARSGEAIP